MRNVSDKLAEKIKTHILYLITFLRKSCSLRENVENYWRAGEVTEDNMVQSHYVLRT